MPDKIFKGSSKKGDFQAARSDATQKAVDAAGPDALIKWKLLDATGERGGIQGKNTITVRIQATLP